MRKLKELEKNLRTFKSEEIRKNYSQWLFIWKAAKYCFLNRQRRLLTSRSSLSTPYSRVCSGANWKRLSYFIPKSQSMFSRIASSTMIKKSLWNFIIFSIKTATTKENWMDFFIELPCSTLKELKWELIVQWVDSRFFAEFNFADFRL